MTSSDKKFSDLIGDLVKMWISWMKNNNIVNDKNALIKDRKNAAIECEKLIKKEYLIVEQLDRYFDKCQKKKI
jgi:hypothetical protein